MSNKKERIHIPGWPKDEESKQLLKRTSRQNRSILTICLGIGIILLIPFLFFALTALNEGVKCQNECSEFNEKTPLEVCIAKKSYKLVGVQERAIDDVKKRIHRGCVRNTEGITMSGYDYCFDLCAGRKFNQTFFIASILGSLTIFFLTIGIIARRIRPTFIRRLNREAPMSFYIKYTKQTNYISTLNGRITNKNHNLVLEWKDKTTTEITVREGDIDKLFQYFKKLYPKAEVKPQVDDIG